MKFPTPTNQYSASNIALVRTLALVAALIVCVNVVSAQSTNAPARMTYDSFRMISDRNIFNPNRFARASGRTAARSTRPASRVESFSLVGIMAYEKGTIAFFDGSKSDYKQALLTGGVVGEYKVAQITPDAVRLAQGTNTFDLKVGMQMRREDEGDWFLSDGSDAPRRRVASSPRARSAGGVRSEGDAGNEGVMPTGAEPEVIILEGGEEANGLQNQNGNGTEPANGTAEPAPEPAPEADGVTDPVLLRLMQRRQQMNQ
jgi:hypothetical protein